MPATIVKAAGTLKSVAKEIILKIVLTIVLFVLAALAIVIGLGQALVNAVN